MTYFCSGFFTLTEYMFFLGPKTKAFYEHMNALETKFNSVKISYMRHEEEETQVDTQVISLFAILDQKGSFEDELQKILFLGLSAAGNPWGVFYCHDSDESKNWMYTITLSPGLPRTYYGGDPFFSPLSDKLVSDKLGAHPFFSPLPDKFEIDPLER